MRTYLSICIPTKGRIAIVKETLDSIFLENTADYDDFEVVLSDNADNDDLMELLADYQQYPNIVYRKTKADGFFNSIAAMQLGRGRLLKLHNDYTKLNPFALVRMIAFVKAQVADRPLVYFSNNELKRNAIHRYDTFDQFSYDLTFLGTWSTGFAIWKDDFDQLSKMSLNKIFPHTTLLFAQHNKASFVINDEALFYNRTIYNKGGYNLFQAFSVQYLDMVRHALNEKHLSRRTFDHIKRNLFYRFLVIWYYQTKIAANSYTYDLSEIRESVTTNYSVGQYYYMIVCAYVFAFLKKIKGVVSPPANP